ncbi:MAG: AarF/UbiB family protein, partial [Chloroflexota bacterium]
MSGATAPRATEPPQPPPDIPPANIRAELAAYRIHWRRYQRTLWFAAWLFARVLLWEVALRWLVSEGAVRRGRPKRLKRWAREFREMAAAMGGVMIKLGQFISSRVDILPPEILAELATLQDEVPTVPFAAIRGRVEDELGPLTDRFSAFEETPVAAASLGQAHRARLPDGERVVVKVLRPGIHSLVATDLKALGVVAGWAMKLPFIRRRANVPALLDEFSVVLWRELDYRQEARNAERFQAMFAADPGVYIPQVYPAYSTGCVLTLEDVSAIKITDYAAISAAGVDRRDVARRLVDTYLEMVFIERFFHADPHPGNLFVYPLPP